MTFSEWIDQKGPKTLGIVLGEEIGTIRVWKHRNLIPRNVWPEITTRLGVTTLQLLAMEEAGRVQRVQK